MKELRQGSAAEAGMVPERVEHIRALAKGWVEDGSRRLRHRMRVTDRQQPVQCRMLGRFAGTRIEPLTFMRADWTGSLPPCRAFIVACWIV
jgi:hypothetical protein